MLWAPKLVVYSYLTIVYFHRSTASLLAGKIEMTKYFTLSVGAFSWAVQYGPASRFAHYQMMSACAGQGALLRVPCGVVGQWFRYGICGILKNVDSDLLLEPLTIARVVENDWDVTPDSNWFSYTFSKETVLVIPASVLQDVEGVCT